MCHSSNFCGISFMLIYIYIYCHCCLILLLDMFINIFSCLLDIFLSSGPDRGRSPVEWGDFPSVCLSVRPSVPPLVGPRASLTGSEALLAGSEACLAGFEACLAGSEAWLAGSEAYLACFEACLGGSKAWLALRPAGLALGSLRGGPDGWTDG